MSAPRRPLKETDESRKARKRLHLRYIITYVVLLILVLGYIWYNRVSSQQSLIPEEPPQETLRESTRFELSPPPAPAPDSEDPPEPTP